MDFARRPAGPRPPRSARLLGFGCHVGYGRVLYAGTDERLPVRAGRRRKRAADVPECTRYPASRQQHGAVPVFPCTERSERENSERPRRSERENSERPKGRSLQASCRGLLRASCRGQQASCGGRASARPETSRRRARPAAMERRPWRTRGALPPARVERDERAASQPPLPRPADAARTSPRRLHRQRQRRAHRPGLPTGGARRAPRDRAGSPRRATTASAFSARASAPASRC